VRLTFTAPNRPLSINEANSMHWAAKRRRLEPWRQEVWLRWLALPDDERRAFTDAPGVITVAVELPFARAGRRDPHNYTSTVVKALIDELVKAGMAPDDTPEYVTVAEPKLLVRKDLCVTVTLTKEEMGT
jgi:hypothetical protein